MFQTKARRPSIWLSSSIFWRRFIRTGTTSSSTIVMMALFMVGHAWLPKWLSLVVCYKY